MRIILAPDSFKGTFSAPEVCRAFEKGIQGVLPRCETISLPLADGGEGTLDVLLSALGGEMLACRVADPLGRKLDAAYGLLADGQAVIEMARTSGLALLKESERDPWVAGTFGLGQVIRAALDGSAGSLVVTLGGSATVDGGVGMARALGFRFLDRRGKPLETEGGRVLASIARIEKDRADPRLGSVRVRALCDVANPLVGKFGAARVFGPQKGAGPEMVEKLELGLVNLASRIREDLGLEVENIPGAGAAGGLGAAVRAFLGGELEPGIDYVLEKLNFRRSVREADWVITGEGSFDEQSMGGKVISGVLKEAGSAVVPVIVICGHRGRAVTRDALYGKGPVRVFSGDDLDEVKKPGTLLSSDDLSALARKAALWIDQQDGPGKRT